MIYGLIPNLLQYTVFVQFRKYLPKSLTFPQFFQFWAENSTKKVLKRPPNCLNQEKLGDEVVCGYAKMTITRHCHLRITGSSKPRRNFSGVFRLGKISAEWKSIYKLVPFPHHFDSPKLGKMMRLILGYFSFLLCWGRFFLNCLLCVFELRRKKNKLPPLLSFSWPLPDWQFSQRRRRLHVVGSWHSIKRHASVQVGPRPRDCWTAGCFKKVGSVDSS